MHVLDLHIQHTFPLVNLNRGEDGSPKEFPFGGVIRGDVSSQAFKRATREEQKTRDINFGGIRTKGIVKRLSEALQAQKVEHNLAENLSKAVGGSLSSKDGNLAEDGVSTKTILFFSDGEIKAIADYIAELSKAKDLEKLFDEDKEKGTFSVKGKLSTFLNKQHVKDLYDIAMYGRMVASDPDMDYDGALACNFAFTIHEMRPTIDFFSAVDEDSTSQGSGHIDEALYNSGTFYRHVSINLDLLKKNLPDLDVDQLRVCLNHTIRSVLRAVPHSKRNSTNGCTYPGRVLGIVRTKATSLTLADVFERPITRTPYMETGWEKLTEHWSNLKSRLGSEIGTVLCEPVFSTDPTVTGSVGIDDFCKEILNHVWK
jgi:CRISPR-associated protein Cas7/Cse4/CasC, subtype I-E/ECOLI